MINKGSTSVEEFETELLKNPEILKEYKILQPKYDEISLDLMNRKED